MIKTVPKKKVRLLNDALFKAIIRSEESREVVSENLNEVTGVEKELLEKASYQGGEIPKQNIEEKGKTSDVIIKLENSTIILEMNQFYTENIFAKNSSYAFAMASRINRRKNVFQHQTILVNFDDFNSFRTKRPILVFQLRDEEGHIENGMYISYHLILENSKEENYNISKKLQKFMDFFREYESINELKEKYKGSEYEKMVKKIEELMEDEEFIGYYDLAEKQEWELQDSYNTGVKSGVKEGEQKKTHEIVQKMINLNMPLEQIMEITNLTKEEIEALK